MYYYGLTINMCELISRDGTPFFTSLSLNKNSNKTGVLCRLTYRGIKDTEMQASDAKVYFLKKE